MRTVLTACPFCGCGCAVYLHASSGRLVASSPSEHHPVSRGRLCARGWTAHQAPVWGERLTTPLIRRGGELTRATWQEAMDHTLERLTALRGAIGVLGSPRATNEENYLAVKLARRGFRTPHVDSCQGRAAGLLLEGIAEVTGLPLPLASLAEVEEADLVILGEGDLARTHPRAAFAVMTALRRGATLVTTGPRLTQLARLSAAHVAAAPGDLWTLPAGLAEVDVEAQLAAAERAVVILAGGAVPAGQARELGAVWASLFSLTGHVDRIGSGLVIAQSRANALGALYMGVSPDRLPGFLPIDDREALDRVTEVWGDAAELAPGARAAALLEEARGILVFADDPITALPDHRGARAALEAVECVVVLDAFVTETVKRAEVVLPIASFAETDGTYFNMTGRLQRVRAAAAPPGQARPGFAVLGELGARLGNGPGHAMPADVFGEIAAVAPSHRARCVLDDERKREAARDVWRVRVRAAPRPVGTSTDRPWRLGLDGDFDWGSDPLIRYSPIAGREPASRRKLFPSGWVEVSRADAEELGVRPGRAVRLSSTLGQVVMPAQIRPELARGVALIPFEHREHAAAVLGADNSVIAVRVEPA